MTPREMTAEDVERVLGYLANGRNNSADLPFEAARVRAHIAALRARAEAAEADNADALYRLEACRATMEAWGFGDYGHGTPELHAYEVCHFPAGTKHPGTGYRAKVRAELLRELAAHHRTAAAGAWPLEKKAHTEEAERLDALAAREEQG